eukprot:5271501-Ditylum_brightwellii.AAC.1
MLYYGRAIDITLLAVLNTLGSAQSKGGEELLKATHQLLDYCSTHPDVKISLKHKVGQEGIFFGHKGEKGMTKHNCAVLPIVQIIKNFMSSATEAELGATFINAKEALYLKTILEEIGYPQPSIKIHMDNSTANEIVNGTIKQKYSKAVDMRFHWLKDRVNQ